MISLNGPLKAAWRERGRTDFGWTLVRRMERAAPCHLILILIRSSETLSRISLRRWPDCGCGSVSSITRSDL